MRSSGEEADHHLAVHNPETGRSLSACVKRQGADLVVSVGGGERPHVGCVVMSVPVAPTSGRTSWSASTSVLTIPPHKEEVIARTIAERLARVSKAVVVVTAGVHDDNLDRSGIEDYVRLGRRLADDLAARLAVQPTP
jgi:hypothetical protein